MIPPPKLPTWPAALTWARSHWRGLAEVLAVLVAFCVGRASAPTKVEERVRTVTVEAKASAAAAVAQAQVTQASTQAQETRSVRDTTVVQKPDGTRIRHTVEATAVDSQATARAFHALDVERAQAQATVQASEAESSRVTTTSRPRFRVGALGGLKTADLLHGQVTPVFGAEAAWSPLPAVWVGGFGLSNGVGGITVGLEW